MDAEDLQSYSCCLSSKAVSQGVVLDYYRLLKKGEDRKMAQEWQNVKALLIQAKKDDERGFDRIGKLDEKIQEL